MKPKFSIFRCPQVVVSIIFKIADPQDLVAVAFCSKRAFKLVKALSPNSKRLQLDLDCVNRVALLRYRGETHQLIRVPYQVGELEYGRKSTRIMFCKQAVQIKAFENGTWIMSFEGAWPSDGFRLVIRWLWKLFSINVTKMWVDGNTVDFVDFLESRQNGLETLVVRTDRSLRQEDYCSMLECRARQVIFDSNSTSLFFYYPGVLPKRDSLIVEDGHWLSNYHLMTSDIKHLEIGNSTLTENDLNQFLRHWLDGGSYRIKLLTVKMRRLKWEVVLAGLYDRFVQLPKDKAVVYRGPLNICQNLSNVRFYFRRGDGVISTINWDHYSDNFHFAVWPDANGQIIIV